MAIKNLRTDTSIKITKADKGNSTVVMDSVDYKTKINELLNKGDVYQELKKDPTPSVDLKVQTTIRDLKKKGFNLSHLNSYNGIAPRLYGLPKIHKVNIPLRPIVSSIGSPTYNIAKFLVPILTPLTGKGSSFVKNSIHFKSIIKSVEVTDSDSLVSFDVESLFTSVPIEDACIILKSRLDEDDSLVDRTALSAQDIVSLTRLCVSNAYFLWDGKFYKQREGAAMGSPLSPILANLYMEWFEEQAISSAPYKPKLWVRYVDDTFVVWQHNREQLTEFLNHLNSVAQPICFTMEVENDNKLPFLDVLVTKNRSKGTVSCSVYRKPTHTDRYLNYSSNHHPAVKYTVARALLGRAIEVCDADTIDSEIRHVSRVLERNGYPKKSDQQHTPQHKKPET